VASQRFRWWHGAAFFAGVQVAAFALKRAAAGGNVSRKRDRKFYRNELLPVFAPPGAAFPVAWTINSICAIAGGLHVLNMPRETEGRSEFLRLQSAAWALYVTFEAAYFGLRSPINAAGVTILYSGATVASFAVAARRLRDPLAAASLAPTLAWLALANPVGITQALWNRDAFWKVGPFMNPERRWLK